MKKLLMVSFVILSLLLVGCASETNEDFSDFSDDAVTGGAASNVVSQAEIDAKVQEEAMKLAQQLVREELAKLNEQKDDEDDSTDSTSDGTLTTKQKFDIYMEDRSDFDYSFNENDCKNGLESIAKSYFANIDDEFDKYDEEVDTIASDDLGDLEDDLDTILDDFKDISFESGFNESDWTTDSEFINFTQKVTELVDAIKAEITNIDNNLDDAQDHLGDEDDYDKVEEDLEDALDVISNDYADAVDDLRKYLGKLSNELEDRNYDDESEDVTDIEDDVKSFEGQIDSIETDLEDIKDAVVDLEENYDEQDDILKELEAICN
ncbi:hypothetical protein KY334_07795 [Candidatus Woesearchaeota archaeon]|nr:hypothetical protein [Candidatus Woesearchaeota archaeon]